VVVCGLGVERGGSGGGVLGRRRRRRRRRREGASKRSCVYSFFVSLYILLYPTVSTPYHDSCTFHFSCIYLTTF